MLEPYDGKLSRTVLRGEGGEIPLTYPVHSLFNPAHKVDVIKKLIACYFKSY